LKEAYLTAGRNSGYNKIDWNTPQKYVDAILAVFGEVDLDPCSNDNSIVPAYYKYILPMDGLKLNWNCFRTYVNPPYGRNPDGTTIYDWLKKCHDEVVENPVRSVMALIPVATNTKHWKEFVFNANVICFLEDTRLKFRINDSEDNKGSSMACAMVLWGNKYEAKFIEVFNSHGNCLKKIQ
jgi:hypothetical protein